MTLTEDWELIKEGAFTRIRDADGKTVVVYYKEVSEEQAKFFKDGYDIGFLHGMESGQKIKEEEISKRLFG